MTVYKSYDSKKEHKVEDDEGLHLDYLLMSKCLCILTNTFSALLNIGETV